jgi:hypothetical protein
MHVLVVCSDSLNFLWYICLVSSMVAGIDGGETFIISNLPNEFMSGLIRSCITCITKTDKALLNEKTSHGRNLRHIFFEPKVLCSYRCRSIM